MTTEQERLQLDLDYPFKAIMAGGVPERFQTKGQAMAFFNDCKGTIHLSHIYGGQSRVIAYKFRR
jgi:hypothetical protein